MMKKAGSREPVRTRATEILKDVPRCYQGVIE
jgi:hypothetical protein